MKKKLLLTSQGLPAELKDVFLSLLVKPPSETKVSFIITAAYGEETQPKWLEIYRQQLRTYGINQIEDLDIKNKNQTELEKIIANKDIIFVNGGNTFYLLKWVKKTGFDKIIKDHVESGKLYIGISAGSYIACPTIEQSNWKHQDRNKVGITDFTALNLVPFIITAHYEEKYRSVIENAAKSTRYPIVALNDKQAMLVEDNNYKLVGEKHKLFFNGFEEN